ncbi:hypothetical protein BCR34DRAFT_203955 [Clohesyomyces aquaticus]|uniref:Rhodopsin domain-containing protein n=1 Tax=Clohesyomyces aquaticus TaxID=1231657 RepID=A0A1Y1YBL6_9PLEO|nr:hypothetical protein BCR34DRAFT_203955 [Clohesyomyces aquaticus]
MAPHDAASVASRGETQQNVAIAFLVLAWFFVGLRIWTRTFVIHNFGWDDGTMILATMLFTTYCVAMMVLEHHGGGTHVTDVSQLVRLTKWTVISETTYLLTVLVLKISLGIFFTRIVVKPRQLWIIWVIVSISVLSGASSTFYAIFRCGPNPDVYVFRQLANQCTSRTLDRFFAYQQASFTTFTDCVFASLPVLILWDASMSTRSKISVGFILSLAALGCICSLVRFKYVDGLTQIDDFFWNATNIAIWSTIEPGAGIIAGCLATLRPFFKGFVNTARSVRSSKASKQASSARSNENSANQKSNTESKAARTGPSGDTSEAQDPEVFDLEPIVSRDGGESTRPILPHPDGPWSTHNTLERERRSFQKLCRRDPQDTSPPLPPLPTHQPTLRRSMV